ncbi:mandelate racemase/muconate lactonizing enzyme family protein [Geminicoccus harenae]|uniref:mandelate racemase/muconate lactonizing enzyme family protein n=1 Tax=Geminicoccus harenae TaxID=2498453 RepID=UPI00168B3FFB|nr:mandelate racemase/muconate lactonizing enzyme family protein [Geminicoccus harenae]
MKITAVTIHDVDYGRDFHTFWNPVIVRIDTDEGIYGAGELGLAYGTGTKGGIHMIRTLAETFLIGADPFRIESIWETFFRRTFWGQGGGPIIYGAMSAIDEALWDIKGKALGVPVYELLGGKFRDEIRVYANGWYTGLNAPEEYAEAALKVVADGYDALKFDPFGTTPEGEWRYPRRHIERDWAIMAVRRVEAVRDAVGPDVDILLDLHGNLGTTDAITYGRMLEASRPFFYEEPVDPMNVACMKKVSANVKIPIAAGERLYTRYQFRPYLESQALDILQPDMGLCGGITEARKIAAYAETYNLHVQPHNCGGPVSTAAGVQLDAAIPNFIIMEWFPYWTDERYAIVTDALEHRQRNSRYRIPERPGLGIELNDDYLARFDRLVVGGRA